MSTKLYLEGATLSELMTIQRFESKPRGARGNHEMWLRLPSDEDFPRYTIVRATPQLVKFIADNSIYGGNAETMERNHYLEIVFRDDDGSALVSMKYQHILGSRWLCVVSQSDVRAFIQSALEIK